MQDEIHKLTKCPDFIITNKSCLEKKEILTEEDQEKKDLKLLHQITNQTFQPSELKKDLTNFVESIKSLNILPIFQLGKIVNIKNNVSQTLYESRIKSFNNNLNSFHERLEFIRENNKKFKNIFIFLNKLAIYGFVLDKNFNIEESDNIIVPDKIILQHQYHKNVEDLINMENKNFKIIYSSFPYICKIGSDFYDYYNKEYSLIFTLKIYSIFFRIQFNQDAFEEKLLQIIKQKRKGDNQEFEYIDDMLLFYRKYILYKFMKEEINGILRYLKEKKEYSFENKGFTFTCSSKPGKLNIKLEYFDTFIMEFSVEKINKIKISIFNDNNNKLFQILKPKFDLFCENISHDIKYSKNINNFISKVKKNQNLTLENIIKSGIFIKRLSKLGSSLLKIELNHTINMRCKELNIINTDFLDSTNCFAKYQLFFKFIQNGNEFSYTIYLIFDTKLNLRINVKEPYLNHIYIYDRAMNTSIEKGKINFKEIMSILKNIIPILGVNNKNGTYLKIISA